MARRPLYLVLLLAVLIALIGSAVLVFTYKPSGSAVAVEPTPSSDLGISGDASVGPSQSQSVDTTPGAQSTGPNGEPTAAPTPLPGSPFAKDAEIGSVAPADLKGYIWPVRHALITSRFGPRDVGGFVIIDGREVHDGLDLATHCGDRVRAAHDGTVLYAGRNFDPYIGYWGDASPIYDRLERLHRVNEQPIVVVIDDGNGYRSMYVHLQEALAEPGQQVKAGDVLGLEGMTGYATGCHLHYGMIRMDGVWQPTVPRLAQFGYPPFVRERVDPIKVLPWGDEFAPQRLKDKFYGVTPSPEQPESPTAPQSPVPTDTPDPNASPSAAVPQP
jgi:murein DD-endopeptidase MepM/ murein hydrolase activator NlpD